MDAGARGHPHAAASPSPQCLGVPRQAGPERPARRAVTEACHRHDPLGARTQPELGEIGEVRRLHLLAHADDVLRASQHERAFRRVLGRHYGAGPALGGRATVHEQPWRGVVLLPFDETNHGHERPALA